MRNLEWLDKIVNDELFTEEQDVTDTNVGDKDKAEWEERFLHTFLGGKENG